jgi:hypothetical protein
MSHRANSVSARQDTAEARHTKLLALLERSGAGVGGGAVNTFVYGPDLTGRKESFLFVPLEVTDSPSSQKPR